MFGIPAAVLLKLALKYGPVLLKLLEAARPEIEDLIREHSATPDDPVGFGNDLLRILQNAHVRTQEEQQREWDKATGVGGD